MKKCLSLLLALFLVPCGVLAEEDEILDADKAFAISLTAGDRSEVTAEWTIADGYYLYRDKIRFSSDTPGVRLGVPVMPDGKVKRDEYFGDVEIYRGSVSVRIPVQAQGDIPETVTITATSQGCSDAGLCYPPHRQTRAVSLPAAATASGFAVLDGSLGLGPQQDDILEPDVAFRFTADTPDPNTITAYWAIAPGHYLYRDKLKFELIDAGGVRLAQPQLPPGEPKVDEALGPVHVFHDEVQARLPLLRDGSAATQVTLRVSYQGCSEAGLCYPPIKKDVVLTLGSIDAGATARPAAAAGTDSPEPAGSDAERFTRLLQSSSLAMVMVYALGFGLLLAFTACMYPMIPIVSGIIVGQGAGITASRGLVLSAIYVAAMALTFGVVGGVMAFFGGGVGIQAYAQSPWLLIPFALLFVVLAMGMFGMFTIQMPSAIQSRLSHLSNRQKGGTLLGVALMGSVSALIIGPCGGPILIAALAYAAAAADLVKGFLALFMLGIGMGLPLLMVGVGGGKLLPRAGGWMNAVKAAAGVILLAVAIVILQRMPGIFPAPLTMLLWGALLIVSATYLGAVSPLPDGAGGWRRLWKGIGLVGLVYGFIVMVGGATGGSNVLDPLHGSSLVAGRGAAPAQGATGTGNALAEARFKRIKTLDDVQSELAAAQEQGKPVILDFYADWCTYCKEFESYVFSDPAVRTALGDFVLLQADVTAMDEEDKQLMRAYKVYLPPVILFFSEGQELERYRVVGIMDAGEFAAHLAKVSGN